MRRSRRWTELRAVLAEDEGSAALEFATAGLLLLLPLVALVVVLGAIQGGAFAVQAAAAQAARIVSTGTGTDETRDAAATAIAFALADYGFPPESAAVAITCEPVAPCPSRGGTVTVSVDLAVPIPFVPGVLGAAPPSVTVSSTATRPVSRFAGAP